MKEYINPQNSKQKNKQEKLPEKLKKNKIHCLDL